MVSLILGGVLAIGSIVAAILQKTGKDKAAAVLEGVLVVLRKLLGVLKNTNDPAVKDAVLAQIRAQLNVLDAIGSKEAKAVARQVRVEIG